MKMNDSQFIPPKGMIGNELPPIDAELRRYWVERHLQGLKKARPDWFNYSDLLSERPIDGFIRQLDTQMLDQEIAKDYFSPQRRPQNQEDFNEAGKEKMVPSQQLQDVMQGVPAPEWNRVPGAPAGKVM